MHKRQGDGPKIRIVGQAYIGCAGATMRAGADPPAGGVALSLRNAQPFDIYGVPAISIPCGFSREGLPIGLQISGPRLGESLVLALAHAFQLATEWHKRPPLV